jgi:Xaa-Pro aminopeptidase
MVREEVIRRALEQTNWDLLACSMPSNVLLVSGYWPAAGYSVALASREGQIILIVPEDEAELAEHSWADEVATYCPVPLDRVATAEEPVFEVFAKLKKELGFTGDRIGFEQAEAFDPAGYAPHLFRGSAARLVRRAFPSASLAPADELLAQMRSIKTAAEIEHIRAACIIAGQAFLHGSRVLRAGLNEAQVAALFRGPLSSCLADYKQVNRCDGFAYCMSGPNTARGFGQYSRSRSRKIELGDLVIVRCHSYADGYWADTTRTYHVGPIGERNRKMFDAVFAAGDLVLSSIRPGTRGAEVDQVARRLFESRGLGAAFRHSTGHGAGFGALDYTARPRLHPKSDDVLEAGMILKIELGVYIEDYGGVRKSDIVTVTDDGAEILTPFHGSVSEVMLQDSQ